MRKKFTFIILLLLMSEWSYSQTVLTDKNGDTTVCISLSQMDGIYTELIQKDSLMSQSYINASKELLLIQILDSADKDINTLKTAANSLSKNNAILLRESRDKDMKILRNRSISIVAVLVTIISLLF